MSPPVLLVAATALHVGFQLTVTWLVYPALLDVSREGWAAAHDRHSWRITPLVGVVYLAVVAATTTALVADPDPATWVSAAASVVAVLTTAALAAPLHSRLGREYDAEGLARLRVVDGVRMAAALAALASALVAAIR